MFYFEECLRAGGVETPSSVTIFGSAARRGALADVGAEIFDVFPRARIDYADSTATVPPCDLLVWVIDRPAAFSLQDVALDELETLGRLARSGPARHVMIYRLQWRHAEVVAGSRLTRLHRSFRWQRRVIGLLSGSTFLRRVFRPLYGQGN